MTNTLSRVGHLPKRPYSMTNGLMWRVVTSGQPRVPYLFPPRKVAARMDVDKFTVTLQLQQVKSRGGKGGWKGYIHPPPKKANSGLKSKTEIWSQKKLPSEHGQKIPRECGSGNISRGHECRTTEGHKPKPEIGKGIGSCRVSSTTCGHSSPHDGRPALKMDFEFTEWANQDRSSKKGKEKMKLDRISGRGKESLQILNDRALVFIMLLTLWVLKNSIKELHWKYWKINYGWLHFSELIFMNKVELAS